MDRAHTGSAEARSSGEQRPHAFARTQPRIARVRGVSTHSVVPLDTNWEVAALAAGMADGPTSLATEQPQWLPATVPGTAADACRRNGGWSIEEQRDFDAVDWWFRLPFGVPAESVGASADEWVLAFGGLATLADVWLNGAHVLSSSSMFIAFDVSVGDLLRESNELLIRCRSLTSAFDAAPPLPRARWRTKIVTEQRLRGTRTTLLGRMPGWTPPAAPVGPWRPVSLEHRRRLSIERADARSELDGDDGVVTVSLAVRLHGEPTAIQSAKLVMGSEAHETSVSLVVRNASGGGHARTQVIDGTTRLAKVAKWWPHTHGAQPRTRIRVVVRSADGDDIEIDLGAVGFRTIERDRSSTDGFALRVNDVPIFCRGACWTPIDVVRLASPASDYAEALGMARDAGMNMLRVGGTMVYESEEFYERCDALGILVWHDFMFANLDYPASDAAFMAAAEVEARQALARLQGRPAVAVLCGGSEVAQQAAMMGLPAERWRSTLFDALLPDLCRELVPAVPYLPSTPWGGTHPFQPNTGVAHYYGVGAYLRPVADARASGVRFASESLAFANVPDHATVAIVAADVAATGLSPLWKARVPQDAGASWDFEDVRDHYVRELFRVDPALLRVEDPERYLALGRVATGELIGRVVDEWRRPHSSCRGALVWLYRDLWPGAGWGLLDAFGRPKAAYYHAKRAMQPVTLIAADEGLNGLYLHALNDSPVEVAAVVTLRRYRESQLRAESDDMALSLPPHGAIDLHADAMLPRFTDLTCSYRFGPPEHDLVVATMRAAADGRTIGEAFYFPLGLPSDRRSDAQPAARASRRADGSYLLTVHAKGFAQSVEIDAEGYRASDAYFHLAPGAERDVILRPTGASPPLIGAVQPLNASSAVPIRVAN